MRMKNKIYRKWAYVNFITVFDHGWHKTERFSVMILRSLSTFHIIST